MSQTRRGRTQAARPIAAMALLSCLAWAVPAAAQVITPALTGQSCAGTRFGRDLGCTSNDFTTVVSFTQPPGGPSTCVAGQTISVDLIGRITSNSPERYDGAIFVGERGNDPGLNNAAQSCSVGVFPKTPLPFKDVDGDACGDFEATSTVDWRITGAQLLCTALANSNTLAIPYVQVFDNLSKPGCTASNVTAGTVAKCNVNTGAGLTGVTVLGYVNLTKQTNPAGDAQRFSFGSTASSGATPQWTLAGAATDQTLGSSQTKRIAVPLSASGGNVTLTITEDATTFWEPGVSISCTAASGSAGNPATFNNATRTITANITNANFGADCTITNTKRSRITIAKSVAGRAVASDQFTVRATGGGTLTDAAGGAISAPVDATTAGAATAAQTTFWSQPAQALTVADLAASGSLANYTSAYACTNATAGSATAMPSGSGTTLTLTPAAGDNITCTYTNTARTVPLTLRKTWQGAVVGNAVNVTATGLSPLASVADTANETDAGAPQVITVGSVVTLAETFTVGDPASYAKTLACTGTNGLSGTTLTAGPADTSIVCTFTNSLVTASWTLAKTTSSSPTAAGQTIAYGFSFTNTGDVSITGISVADLKLPGLSCTLASLAAGATASCAATGNVYTVTQADVDAGSVANTATATGTPAAGTLPAATDSVTVSITASPSLSIIKPAPSNADNDGSGTVTINDVLTYTVTATNTGNVTLSNVAVSDPQLTPTAASCASVVPAATCVLTGTRTVVQADVTAGKIDNTATASSDQTAAVTASVSTPTSVRPVVANDDNGSSGGLNGGTAVANVLANDTLNGVAVNAADVTLSQVSTTSPNVTLNPATGAVTVAAGTAAGPYTVVYRLCENLNPTNCDTANVSVTVTAATIAANDDSGSASGLGGGTAVANVLVNDTLNGSPVDAADVTLSQVSTTSPNVTLNPATGAVAVAAGTPAGPYTVVYRLCANLNPTNCDTANVSVTVTAATIVANADSGSASGLGGGTAVANVLANDTLNGVAVNAADVTLSQVSTTSPNVTLNAATGAIAVAAGTPAGVYTVVYRLCENLNPTNCDTAAVTVTVTTATIAANDDSGSASGLGGGTAVANVLVNDTLNGVAVNAADVTLSQVSTTNANVTLNPATGAVAVAAGTPAGPYTVVYRLCENLNPTNCDTANVSVTVTAATIVANNDSGSTGGAVGGIAVTNVLANDTLGGLPVNAADVTLSQVSATSPNVTLNAATGAIAVAAGTPAGVYTVVYRLCENLNPTNCDTANVSVTVTAATIAANDDSGSASGLGGGTAVANVLANDTLNGVAVNAADVTLSQVSTTSPNVTLNAATGAIAVAIGTPAGLYTVVYRLCENLNPANCGTANVSVTVTAATIAANDDNGSADGATGGVAVSNVVANDRLGGVPANLADVTLVQVSTTNARVSLDPATGRVSVATGTPAGTYTLVYQVCENLNPANCDTANVSVTVAAGTIEASPDAGSAGGAAGGTAVANVLVNDTLDDVAINPADVTLSQVSTTSANVTLDPATGRVSVATGTPAGTYTLVYQVCENLNPANCDTANVTVTVTAAVLGAENDSGSADSATGGVLLPSVLDNDTLNGVAVNPADVTLSQVSTTDASVTLDTVTGLVDVVAGTAPGTYTLVYRICENLNPSNCDTASVTVLVTAASIVANPDTASLGGLVGGTLPTSVLANDQLNGAPVNPSEVTLTQVSGTSPNVSLDAGTGRVSVAAGTPAGTYTLVYEICEVAVPANCDSTSVTVTVTAAVIAANDDSGSTGGRLGGTAVANVLGNDTLNGAAANPADVTLTQLASTHANIALNVATSAVTVAAGTPAGAYTVDYQICQVLNPANCDAATVSVTVRAAIWAVSPDIRSIDGSAGGTAPPSVLDNDTLGGAPVDPSAVTLSQVSSTSPNVTIDTATGQVSVAPGTPAGTYTLVYQVCENLNPTNCGTTSVTVAVTVDALVANPDQRSIDGSVGGTAPPSVLDNDILGGAAVDPAEVTLAQVSSSSPNVSLDTATGQVSAIAGTPAGTYTLVYEICEIVNPANCSQATVTLTVTAADLLANDDSGSADGAAGGAAGPSVLANDTLNGSPVNPADVTLSEVSSTSAGVSLNPATGRVNVAPGTPAGTHTLVYRVCENLNPANCDTASVTVTVLGPALGANPDAGSSGGRNGGTAVANVLANDTLNGAPAGLADVTLRQVSSTSANVSLDPASGAVSVAAGTPAGTYTLVYEVCERLDPSSCATAAVSVTVTAAALVANADAGSVANGTAGGTAVANVLANDMLGGAAMSLADVTLRQVSSDSASVALDVNTGAVTVAPGTAAGPYTLVYEVCETLNPANCATATVSITVAIVTTAPVAVDDSFTAPEGGPVSGNLAANDTGGGTPGVYTLVAGSGPGNGAIVINADGTFSYTPNPGFVGNDTFRYQVCGSGGNCSTASVSLTITPQPGKLRVSKAASSPQAGAASIVGFTITITNVSAVPVRAAELVDQPSPGFSLVAGSVRVRDEDDAGEVRGASPFTVAGIDVAVGATATVSYLMRVSAGLPAGEYANLATMTQLGAAISNTASARVRTGSGLDPDTEQARVLGKVFDDQNGDGWQDAGERGIPGVRVATVEGLVAETDAHGRFHFEGLTLSNAARGQNVIAKVDAATLPAGSVFTTENPLVRRVTQGLPVRFDFGVRLPPRRSVTPGDDASRSQP